MVISSISASWLSSPDCTADTIIETVKSLGIDYLEAEFRMSAEMLEKIVSKRESGGLNISSMHAVCPSPANRGRGAEAYFLSDTDEDKRKKGIDDVLGTIKRASAIGVPAVIVHSGMVDIEEATYKMMEYCDAGNLRSIEARECLHSALLNRMSNCKKSFSSLLKSLDAINSYANKVGVKVGLENRFYFREMPNLEEFGIIFNTFNGGSLGYWHDTGHAHVQETLFGVSQKMMLETFSERLVGVHLHDVRGGYTDHNAPGSGVVDFDMVKSFLKDDTIRVMELNKRESFEDAKSGVDFLKEKGIFGSVSV